ncbi:MAG: DUF3775 domain-containing protein [Alphaproteobacteria bacterium]|nr:DUF3775 domain-containing protein [Alphaproteobacteria bacterium]
MRATITMPLETLKAIIERAREYEFVVDDDDVVDEELDEGDDEIEEDELDADEDDEEMIVVAASGEDVEEDDIDEDEDADEEEEFADVLDGLTSEELAELLALAWVGEGDHSNWDEALGAARALPSDEIILQLAENPMLSDAIVKGLAALGYEISEN